MIKKIVVIIFLIITFLSLLFIIFKIGYYNGKLKEKESREYIIKYSNVKESSEELRKKGYNLILKGEEVKEERKIIPNTKLKIDKNSVSKRGVEISYITNNDIYGKSIELKYYILEKKIGDKWYKVEPVSEKGFDEIQKEIIFRDELELGKEYQIYKDFSEYTKIGLPKGIYRVVFPTYINLEKYYIMAEFEIK